MHSLLILFSLGLAGGGTLLCVIMLGVARSSSSRRAVQGVGLFLPVALLGLLAATMIHFLSQLCFQTAPLPDVVIARTLSLIGGLGIAAVIALNGGRALLLPLHLRRHTWEAPEWLGKRVIEIAHNTGLTHAPRTRVSADPRPWALVAGLYKPYLVVSSGLVGLLDGEELDAVLNHELTHIRRGDLLWTAIGGVLRDLTWFLPATLRLYHFLLTEQEIACDDCVLGEPRRLALASALARVWQNGIEAGPTPRGALTLLSPEQSAHFEARVQRLLDYPGTSSSSTSRRALLAVAVTLGLFVPAQLMVTLLVMNSMGCGMQGFLATIIH